MSLIEEPLVGRPGQRGHAHRRAAAAGPSDRRWLALAALGLAVLVVGLDTTVVVTALPTLSVDLRASTSQLQWVMNAYTLVLAGLLLPAGVLGDRYGRRRLLLAGLAVFGAGSIVASQVMSASGLITLRAVMGVGAAAIVPLAFSILAALFGEQERPRAIAVLAAAVFLGVPLGPLVAGWLLTSFMWGSIFLINAPVVVLAIVGVWLCVPESRDERPGRVDWAGAALSVVGVTALVYGIIEQPVRGWTGPRVLTGLVLGVAFLVAFVVRQRRAAVPLIDLGWFASRRFTWASAGFVVVGFALGGVMFVLAPYLQLVQGNDAEGTGLRLIPLVGGIVAGAVPSARLGPRWGAKVMLAAGLLVTGVGAVLLSRIGVTTGFGAIGGAEAVIGLGLGLAMPTAADTILGALPSSGTGTGMALTRTMQFVAMSLGVAILGSILNAGYQAGLRPSLGALAPPARAAAEQGLAGAARVPEVLAAARVAYVSGMADVMLVSAAVLAIAAVLVALFLPRQPARS